MERYRTKKSLSFFPQIIFLLVPLIWIFSSTGWAKTVSVMASSEAWYICYEDYFPDKTTDPPKPPSQPGQNPCADALSKCQDDVTEDIIHIALQHADKCSCNTPYKNQYNECYSFACDETFYVVQIKNHIYSAEKASVETACPLPEAISNPGYSQNKPFPIIFIFDNIPNQGPNLNMDLIKNSLDLFGNNSGSPQPDPNSPSPTPNPSPPTDPNVNVSSVPSGGGNHSTAASAEAPSSTSSTTGCSLTVAQMNTGSLSHAFIFAFSLLPLILRWRKKRISDFIPDSIPPSPWD